MNSKLWRHVDPLSVRHLRQKLSKFVLNVTHIEHGHHAPSIQAATCQIQTLHQQLHSFPQTVNVGHQSLAHAVFHLPPQENSQGMISSDVAGQELGPVRSTDRFGKRWLRYACRIKLQCGGVPSCCASCTEDRRLFPLYPSNCWMSQWKVHTTY